MEKNIAGKNAAAGENGKMPVNTSISNDYAAFVKKGESSVMVQYNGIPAGNISFYAILPGNDNYRFPLKCTVDRVGSEGGNTYIEAIRQDEDIRVTLSLEACRGGFYGRFAACGKGHAIIRMVWEIPPGERGFPFIPAFMYGHNEGGRDPGAVYPQLDSGGSCRRGAPWISSEWLVRTDRSSHGTASVITDNMVYALGGRDVCRYTDGTVAEKTGLGVSSSEPHRLTYSLGFANYPLTYSYAHIRNYFGRPEGYINMDKGEAGAEIFLFLYPCQKRHRGAARLIREAYAVLHDRVADAGGMEECIGAVSDALVKYLYNKEEHCFNLAMYTDSRITETCMQINSGWAGGIPAAYGLLTAGYDLGNEVWRKCAADVFDNITSNAVSKKSGMFFENYDVKKREWNSRGWWYGEFVKPGHSGYVNGQICYYTLLAWKREKEAGVDRPGWLEAVRKVLDKVASVQGEDGRFGYTHSEEDGSIVDGDGFSGCWFTPAFTVLCNITGEGKYLDASRKAMDFYRTIVETFHVYGGPHDTNKSPDEEGILAWIEAARALHEATGEECFLEDLLLGLDYEFSWRFAYNVVNEVEPLKSLNWCSTGGSVTSVNNSHIHPMGSAIANSMLYAAEATGDPYLRSRLIDTVRWTLAIYLHFDGHYGWGKKGMVNERFCYTDSLLLERFADGSPASTWFCAMTWPAGSVLNGLTGNLLKVYKRNRAYVMGNGD